ncbi:MAG: helix-turn-helix domain-containing protein [Myxococcales bacterium]|nr:MAG: helix-turn-helix domain-containing protein [Myxococcales bacterium]
MSSRALADFLRERRARLQPTDVGLEAGAPSRRRTPGLRRDEVAARSRMSTEYYTQLEQARGAHPSGEMLAAIARALLLTPAEHEHLYHLAGLSPPPAREAPRVPAPSLLALLDRLTDTAVMVVDAKQDLIAWNPLATLLFEEDFALTAPAHRNLARRYFLDPDPRRYHFGLTPANAYARYAASELRRAQARYPGDAAITALIDELRRGSPHFARLWETSEVINPRHMQKKLVHGTAGPIFVRCDALVVPDDDQRVVLFTARPRTRSARAIRALAASIPARLRGTRALPDRPVHH